MKKELTKEEDELIEAIRMYKRSFPNGYPRLLWYAQELFDEITESKEQGGPQGSPHQQSSLWKRKTRTTQ